jgi:hypothetical protein
MPGLSVLRSFWEAMKNTSRKKTLGWARVYVSVNV